ncbi:MAG: acyl-ACP--UDP-N-acetylglucosamine O-acyltransferase [Pseudomonadota bacterium]
MSNIHSTAIVEDGATLGADVKIGPYCHVGPQVTLGDGVQLVSHVVVAGNTTVGTSTRIFPFASIGHEPQDLKYGGEDVSLVIGSGCIIREGVTMNPGTAGGGSITSVGNNCAFLANTHVAHDCRVGNNVIMSNNAGLSGHTIVGDFAIFGGGSGSHQFCRVGHHAFVGGLSGIEGDLIPFGMAVGNRADLGGINIIGMKRTGVSRESIHAVRAAYKDLFSKDAPILENAQRLKESHTDKMVLDMVEFVLEGGDRPLCTPKNSKK